MTRHAGLIVGMLFLANAAAGQFAQQGEKLFVTGDVWIRAQGSSVAISRDGSTAIVGGWDENSGAGAAWVYTHSGGVWTQQGSKLAGTGAVGGAEQGTSVAISADGNTAIIGGGTYSSTAVGAYVFTRSEGVWSQQGGKLVGTGAYQINSTTVGQGQSVAISADGNTAIVGGPNDNNYTGATWVFTRSEGVWSQQGGKLVGTGAYQNIATLGTGQGYSVAISADGNAAIVGGPNDNNYTGAAWVFTRSGSAWSQQGSKLVGTGVTVGSGEQGYSVAIAADGNTAVVGSYGGGAWVFTRSEGVWSQQGSKLVGTGAVPVVSEQGNAVALSADGNIAIIGGPHDGDNAGSSSSPPFEGTGATWVFTRSNGVWTQQGSKLVGTGGSGGVFGETGAQQGSSVALSADGNTAIVGGPNDNSSIGAAWVFSRLVAPSITWQPRSQSIVSGQTATLAVVATGTEPLSYRWYQGNSGDTSMPVGANASTFTTPPLESTTSYWVWVFNGCGTADSATATITVEPRVRRHLRRAM